MDKTHQTTQLPTRNNFTHTTILRPNRFEEVLLKSIFDERTMGLTVFQFTQDLSGDLKPVGADLGFRKLV